MSDRKIIVGTRGSKLALTQTNLILDEIKELNSEYKFDIRVIKTKGDAGQVNHTGAFVKEIEWALLQGQIDIAVHSLKDMPTEEPKGLKVAAITKREDVRDVLISSENIPFIDLPPNAVVGTGSPRRLAQLKALRSDIEFKYIQGNVDSRIQKMRNGKYDAIVLAAAGLVRLDMKEVITEYFDLKKVISAVGQGALAIQVRSDDEEVIEIVKKVDHQSTRIAVEAERLLLKQLGGGCRVPIAAYATVKDNIINIDGIFANENCTRIASSSVSGKVQNHLEIAMKLAKQLQKDQEAL